MADLNRFKLQRANLKRQLTIFDKFLDEAHPTNDYDEVALRAKKMDDTLEKFADIHIEISLLNKDDAHDTYRDEFEECFYATLRKARKFLTDNAQVSSSLRESYRVDNNISIENNSSNVRFPKIDLPFFDGAYDKWMCFSDTFKAMIHNKINISNIEKLHYLRSCLKGEAAAVIQSLISSDENYEIAWSLLVDRYDNKRVIVQNHLKALLNQPAITRESAITLRQLLNNINTHSRALKVLGLSVDTWDAILIFLMTSKLDKTTHQEWEKTISSSELPTLKQFTEFLKTRIQILEATIPQDSNDQIKIANQRHKGNLNSKSALAVTQYSDHCNYCQDKHKIYNCEKFLNLPISERLETVKKQKLCFNCLRKNHSSDKCKCGHCKKCNKKHNTLLHIEQQENSVVQPSISVHHAQSNHSSQILLATAQVVFLGHNNKRHIARVVLDGGSQAHFITERLANKLKLRGRSINTPVTALNQIETNIKHMVSTKISSVQGSYEANLSFLVIPTITTPLPSQQIDTRHLHIPKNIQLADPTFYKTSEIDGLLGAEIFYNILCVGQINIDNQFAVLQKTRLGWVVAGTITNQNIHKTSISCNLAVNSLNLQLSRFWELEEIPERRYLSDEESEVERHYVDNTIRDHYGRYIVKLPFNKNIEKLGESYSVALRRFYRLEMTLNKNPELKSQYVDFLREYEELNHMSVAHNDSTNHGYYLPHHAVIKESSTTTKVRVVFDGSAKSSSSISLNDTLRVGPTIQDDLFSIILRFRIHTFVLVADIEKMYRQILIDPTERHFQKILWRENSNDPPKTYHLNTVTYGTASAPFLAIRTLHKLADDEQRNFPLASKIVKRDFYVDDLLTGSDTFENAIKLRDDINSLLRLGGFKLRKWSSNDSRLVSMINNDTINLELFKDPTQHIKTLGIQWNPQYDTISYSLKSESGTKEKVTKRNIFSNIAKLFDPIGLLGPIIIKAKLLVQNIWKHKIEWDESVPLEIHSQWINFKNQLPLLNDITFDRGVINTYADIQLHGFCDASEVAYGACFYIRSIDKNNKYDTNLLCSKSKVAPLNARATIPRLELCAALLLSRLYKTLISALPIKFTHTFFWSDSTITLNWINTQPNELKTFVSNRVSEIRTLTNPAHWYHVSTKDNPADYLSRGQSATEFLKNKIWKFGPYWLCKNQENWPLTPINKIPLPEVRKTTVLSISQSDTSILHKFSNIIKLTRVISYCLRFAEKCSRKSKYKGDLSLFELQRAHICIIKLVQGQNFSREFIDLKNNKAVSKKSSLRTLNAFLDNDSIIRVGGRLQQSQLPYDARHPIILPKNNHITNLIIKQAHEKLLHAGVQSTLYQVRTQYWPIDGKNMTKHIIHSCIKCFKFRATKNNYVMGNLPETRVTASRPFSNTGIDYCGPFFIKEKKYRNRTKVKIYVVIFICFSTKAIHLEIVSDLSTETFLAALKRFFSRRGKSKNIYSDNGTNFVGANNELKELYELVTSKEHNKKLRNSLINEGINWHFIPPRSPHFGGLWESAVKLFKNHFLRIIGNTLLTFEEFNTYVIEIEAILNSRPITPLSNDPNDLSALTPGHFLIHDSFTSIPDVDFSSTTSSRLSNWQHLQQLKQHFWKRWHHEYLNQLHVRTKWHQASTETIKIGSMVLIKEDNLPPLQWMLGRIKEIHPGIDGVIRVVTVHTVKGDYKRPTKKIAVLPIEQ